MRISRPVQDSRKCLDTTSPVGNTSAAKARVVSHSVGSSAPATAPAPLASFGFSPLNLRRAVFLSGVDGVKLRFAARSLRRHPRVFGLFGLSGGRGRRTSRFDGGSKCGGQSQGEGEPSLSSDKRVARENRTIFPVLEDGIGEHLLFPLPHQEKKRKLPPVYLLGTPLHPLSGNSKTEAYERAPTLPRRSKR